MEGSWRPVAGDSAAETRHDATAAGSATPEPSPGAPARSPAARPRARMRTLGLLAAFIGGLIAGLAGGWAIGQRPPAVATVNGQVITQEQLYRELLARDGGATLSSLIDETLIDQEAARKGVAVSDADVAKAIDKIRGQVGGDAALKQALTQYGMTLADLERSERTQLEIRGILAPTVHPTDEDLRSYFTANQDRYGQPEEVRVQHILVASEAEADDVKRQLDQGADFSELAKKYSLDAQTKDRGGELGWIAKGQTDPAFEAAAFALEPGETSDPVETAYGWHVIRLEDRKAAVAARYEDVKDEVREDYIDDQVAQMTPDWLTDLRAKATIVNRLAPAGSR